MFSLLFQAFLRLALSVRVWEPTKRLKNPQMFLNSNCGGWVLSYWKTENVDLIPFPNCRINTKTIYLIFINDLEDHGEISRFACDTVLS